MINKPTANAYRFFQDHSGSTFELAELADPTGWKSTTVRTYIAKKWQGFLQREGPGLYRVVSFDFSEQDFAALQTQVSPIIVPEPEYDYDPLSFAGEDRNYVEQVAAALHELGIRVFYDRYEEVDYGVRTYIAISMTYIESALAFVSYSYRNIMRIGCGPITNVKAHKRARSKRSQSISCRFDSTEVPGMLPTTGYIDANTRAPDDVALMIARKTGLDTDLQKTLQYLRESLPKYEINLEGTSIRFYSEAENYDGSFPTRLLVEMY